MQSDDVYDRMMDQVMSYDGPDSCQEKYIRWLIYHGSDKPAEINLYRWQAMAQHLRREFKEYF